MKDGTTSSNGVNRGTSMNGASMLLGAAIALVFGASALHNILYGASIREEAARLQAEVIGVETRELCGRLGIGVSSERFLVCSEVLSEARRNEATRLARDAAGIL